MITITLGIGAFSGMGVAATDSASSDAFTVKVHTDAFTGKSVEPTRPAAVYEYPVDPDALKETFRSTGTVTFLAPPGTPMTVLGEEKELFTSRNIYEWSLAEGMVKIGEITSIPLHGRVDGIIGSTAILLLGEWGIYGEVTVPAGMYELEPRKDGEGYTQVVRFYADPTGWPPMGPGETARELLGDGLVIPVSHDPSLNTISRIWLMGDAATVTAKSNWVDLGTSAFNQHVSMWTASKVKIDLRIDGTGRIIDTTISSTTSCDQTAQNLANYLGNYYNTYFGPWWHQAHNFWSGYAWTNNGGCGVEDSHGYGAYDAIAISPMADSNIYDVDSQHNRGISSGHELGHVYGSLHWEDYTNAETNAQGEYEIMTSDTDDIGINQMAHFLGATSRSDINCRFYHNDNTIPC